ncbi:efflux RND transporter permease subunit [Acanthopleuribacter pedis]|uniref:MMPL family transporter n=1 Tax=Acanthopleuribacter pedis TaxID=442870 RepID=A0A8J7QCY6_9BACT|nr:MMPL family transporter [Acanthopleuribacter pedis]MBO1318731.1 MMPL family transporter [Acanthopleuribacter pedis]
MSVKTLKHKRSQTFLRRLAAFLHRRHGLVLFCFFVLTLFFAGFAAQLEQKTTVRDLLPADNEVVRRFEETVQHFDLIDRVVVAVQFEPEHLESAEVFAELLVEQVEAQPESAQYFHWIRANLLAAGQRTNWHAFLKYLTRLMPEEHIPDLAKRLSPEGIAARVAENRRELESGVAVKALIEKDPLNLLEFAGGYRNEIAGNYQISFNDGFLVSKDDRMLVILAKPTDSPENVDFSVALTDFLKGQIEITKQAFAEEEGLDADTVFSIGLTGPHPITAIENSIIKGDVVSMFLSSFAMVVLLFSLAYRRPLAVFYVGIPLFAAQIWTLGSGYLLFGRLNLMTATFSAIIVGLGIDYAIHIFSRYLDERGRGKVAKEAMETALAETGLGTFVGGLTTALAFLALGFSDFSGLREFAIIAAVGIFFCLLQMFVLLPCMLFFREARRRNTEFKPRAQWDFHLEVLLKAILKFPRTALALLIAGTLILLVQAVQLRFNTDLRSVRAKSNEAINLQSEITNKIGGSLRSLTFLLEAPTEVDLYAAHDKLVPVLRGLKEEGKLVRWDSLLSFLQSPRAQTRNTASLRENGLNGDQVREAFKAAMEAENFRETEDSTRYIENLAAGLDAGGAISLQDILATQSPFVRPFLSRHDGKYKALIHVYPSSGLWDKNAVRALTQDLLDRVGTKGDTQIHVTGIQTISEELKRLVKQSFQYSTLLSGFLVIAIMWYHFRKPSLMMLTLTPLLMAVVWMLGTMRLLGIDITVLNFVATPLIIGIGIDDGVHIVEKYLHRKSNDTAELVKLTADCGKAVTLTSLTTIFGFSSLFLANYSGFRSLGLCAILGVFFCWLGSVIMLPLLMDVFNVRFVRHGVSHGNEPVD